MKLPIKILLYLIVFFFFFTKPIFASFEGGINIGPHLEEFERAAQLSNWVYVMIYPEQMTTLIDLWNKYPDTNVIIRGHFPDSQGDTLNSENANRWVQALSTTPRLVYFMPVNEPNNPNESQNSQGQGGISANTVVNYITTLRNEGLFNNQNVRVLSPAIDVYTMADGPQYSNSNYASQLGDNFFSQFNGLVLNLYGQYKNGELDTTANKVKQGDYKQFIQDYLGITGSPKIFAVETGVKRVEDAGVRYAENSNEIVKYFNAMKSLWGQDQNVIMYAIFSYDPAKSYEPWIYDDSDVLEAMELNPANNKPTIAPPSSDSNPEIDMYNITKRSNMRLLPESIHEANKQKTPSCNLGLRIGNTCLLGNTQQLAGETENFQPVYVPNTKVVSARNCGIDNCAISDFLFTNIIAPQMANKLSGSLNAYRPSQLNFSNSQTLSIQDSPVLAESTNPQQETINSYNFTMKMLLPASIGGAYADIPAIESPTPIPTSTPVPTVSITPSISPFATPTPSVSPPPSTGVAMLKDPSGSEALKQLFTDVANHYKLPSSIIAAVSWIEGPPVWSDSQSETTENLKEGVRHPAFSFGIGSWRICNYNTSWASGPMQFTVTTWEGYKNSVRQNPGQENRDPIICNLMDSVWAAGNKLKTDSNTLSNASLDWDKEAVRLAGWHYYGQCGACDSSGDWDLTHDTYGRNDFACKRFERTLKKAMSYCEYMWLYYDCNKKSENSDDFYECIGGARP